MLFFSRTMMVFAVPCILGALGWVMVTLLHVQDEIGVYGENIKNIEGRIVRANTRMDDLESRVRPLEKTITQLECVTRPSTCR